MKPHPRFADASTTIFEEMSGLARQTGAINLGQGFPESAGPLSLRQSAAKAALEGWNQYAPSRGMTELRAAVVEHYNRLHGTTLDQDRVLITSGATEALAASLMAWVNTGDEVIVFEPAYDAYRPLIERAGGVVKPVRLDPPHWQIDEAALRAAVTSATRMVLFNNPMNPASRVFSAAELDILARVCVEHDLVAVSDEVWEHIVFDGREHLPLALRPGMRERTIKIGSAGKMFGLTGWKIGFVCAEPNLIEPVAKAHQFIAFATPPLLQSAVAEGLAWDKSAFNAMRLELEGSRNCLKQALEAEAYVCLDGQGAYFLSIDLKASGLAMGDVDFCQKIVRDFGVAGIPVSAFVTDHASGQDQGAIVRLCFAKPDSILIEAAQRLGAARKALMAS